MDLISESLINCTCNCRGFEVPLTSFKSHRGPSVLCAVLGSQPNTAVHMWKDIHIEIDINMDNVVNIYNALEALCCGGIMHQVCAFSIHHLILWKQVKVKEKCRTVPLIEASNGEGKGREGGKLASRNKAKKRIIWLQTNTHAQNLTSCVCWLNVLLCSGQHASVVCVCVCVCF